MPWRAIAEYPSFFASIFGALVGGGIVYGTTMQVIRDVQAAMKRHDNIIEQTSKQIEEMRIAQKDGVDLNKCRDQQMQCHKYLCKKLDELIAYTKILQERSESDRISIAEIKAFLATQNNNRKYSRNSG